MHVSLWKLKAAGDKKNIREERDIRPRKGFNRVETMSVQKRYVSGGYM